MESFEKRIVLFRAMNRFLLTGFLFLMGGIVLCRAQAIKNTPGFEFSLTENLLTGSRPLMNYAGISIGYGFKTNDKLMLDLSFGMGITGQNNKTQILSLMYGHEFRHSSLFGTQIGIGPGIMRDIDSEGVYTVFPVAVMDIQHRIYFTPKSYVGFSGKAFLSKDSYQASFLGFVWGAKL